MMILNDSKAQHLISRKSCLDIGVHFRFQNLNPYIKVALSMLPLAGIVLSVPFFQGKYTYECLIISLMVWLMFFAILNRQNRTSIFGYFTPINIFCFTYTIYFVLRPIDLIVNDKQIVEGQDDVFLITMVYLFFGLVAYLTGYLLAIRQIKNRIALTRKQFSNTMNYPKAKIYFNRSVIVSVLTLLIGLFLFAIIIEEAGGLTNILADVGRAYSEIFTKKIYLLSIAYSLIITSLLVHLGIAAYRRKGVILLLLHAIFAAMIFAFFGSRGQTVLMVVLILFFYNMYVKKINAIKIIMMLTVLVSFMIFYENLRSLSGTSQIPFSARLYEFVVGTNDEMRPVLTFVSEMPEKLNFLYGKSFFQVVLQPIPRSLWPEKPKLFIVLMKDVFFPEYWDRGLSWPPSIIGELYANFHVFGIVVGMFLFGYLSGKLYCKAEKEYDYKWIALYGVCLYFILQGVRGDFGTIIPTFILTIFPFCVLSDYISVRSKRLLPFALRQLLKG